MTSEKHFASARNLLAWAQEDINDIESRWSAYIDSKPVEMLHDFNILNQHSEFRFRVKHELPSGFDKPTHNAANAIRHSFDQMFGAAIAAIDPAFDNKTYFPWGNSPADVVGRIRKDTPLPPSIDEIILNVGTYPPGLGAEKGDEAICQFGKTVNSNKHILAVTSYAGLDNQPLKLFSKTGRPIDVLVRYFLDPQIAKVGVYPIASVIKSNQDLSWEASVAIALKFAEGVPVSGQWVREVLIYAHRKATAALLSIEDWVADETGKPRPIR